jgi:hypothetical protein
LPVACAFELESAAAVTVSVTTFTSSEDEELDTGTVFATVFVAITVFCTTYILTTVLPFVLYVVLAKVVEEGEAVDVKEGEVVDGRGDVLFVATSPACTKLASILVTSIPGGALLSTVDAEL